MKLFQRFTVLALVAGIMSSALVIGCGGDAEETSTTTNSATGTTTTTETDTD